MEAVEKPEETIPGNSSRLAGNPNWGTATVVGIFAGMLYGGSKEASASVVISDYSLLLRNKIGLGDSLVYSSFL
ncbi:hypothetical protein F2Q68_00004109 [Brassica cretica]|uniref:Uncharacterized protein n=2 Tax=Brassica cretica TaxID=69181 RepID=A0ABQ7BU02_BRACR|nr:hypothetical protein F2Q68_00004109 [Brassica cretica]KAF3543310.1 hypothetical protein DY000_02005995 [Brassica cretica]